MYYHDSARSETSVRYSELRGGRYSEVSKYSMYGRSSSYIVYCPLYGRCPLFGVSAKRGSTVVLF